MTGHLLRYATHVHTRDVAATPPEQRDAQDPARLRLVDAVVSDRWRTHRPAPSPGRASFNRLLLSVEVTLAILFLAAVLT